MKPVIIYVSGAPGSGKTTLARAISKQLNIHHISSDLIHGGVAYTRPNHDRKETIYEVFVPYLIETAKLGITFVVDHVLIKDNAKETIVDKLHDYAHVINIHTQATDPIARFRKNIETHESKEVQGRRDFLLSRAEVHSNNLVNTLDPIDLGIPRLVVNTDGEYKPTMDEILAFISAETKQG